MSDIVGAMGRLADSEVILYISYVTLAEAGILLSRVLGRSTSLLSPATGVLDVHA